MPQTRLNPLTALVIGASGWILALGINTPIASLAIIAAALTAGTWRTRNPSVAAATALLAAPVAASMVLIHAPYGEHRIAPLITSDGFADAAHLTARFTALVACLLKQRPITTKTVVPHLIMPVLTELLTQAGARGQALETAGYDLSGPRTVLRSVHDSPAQRAARVLIPLICVAVVLWI